MSSLLLFFNLKFNVNNCDYKGGKVNVKSSTAMNSTSSLDFFKVYEV